MFAHHGPILESIADVIGSFAAISTGLASIITAVLSSRLARRRALSECDQRIAELRQSFREGMKLADRRPLPRRFKKEE